MREKHYAFTSNHNMSIINVPACATRVSAYMSDSNINKAYNRIKTR